MANTYNLFACNKIGSDVESTYGSNQKRDQWILSEFNIKYGVPVFVYFLCYDVIKILPDTYTIEDGSSHTSYAIVSNLQTGLKHLFTKIDEWTDKFRLHDDEDWISLVEDNKAYLSKFSKYKYVMVDMSQVFIMDEPNQMDSAKEMVRDMKTTKKDSWFLKSHPERELTNNLKSKNFDEVLISFDDLVDMNKQIHNRLLKLRNKIDTLLEFFAFGEGEDLSKLSDKELVLRSFKDHIGKSKYHVGLFGKGFKLYLQEGGIHSRYLNAFTYQEPQLKLLEKLSKSYNWKQAIKILPKIISWLRLKQPVTYGFDDGDHYLYISVTKSIPLDDIKYKIADKYLDVYNNEWKKSGPAIVATGGLIDDLDIESWRKNSDGSFSLYFSSIDDLWSGHGFEVIVDGKDIQIGLTG